MKMLNHREDLIIFLNETLYLVPMEGWVLLPLAPAGLIAHQ